MAAGRIINRALLQAASRFLGIEGVKQFPATLDLGDIKVTYDLGNAVQKATPNAGGGLWQSHGQTPTIVGLPQVDCSTLLQSLEDGVSAFRVDTLHMQLTFNPAGALAFNLKPIRFQLLFHYMGGDPGEIPFETYNPVFTIATGRLEYYWSLTGGLPDVGGAPRSSTWRGRVPPENGVFGAGILRLMARLTVIDGTNFPAGTVLQYWTTERQGTNGQVPDL